MENVIETKALCYAYNKNKVIHEINLEVPNGSIYCFLGPNGAGKTTLIKIMLSLLQVEKGEVLLFNKDLKKNRKWVLSQIGSVIENPSLYGHLTGIENLLVYSKILGVGKKRVEEVMEIARISHAAKKKVRQYSLGMKQRLEIARSLLSDPQLLILDEPTNGLDPQGIKEIREFIIGLNKDYGKTIFLSSHLLDEVQRMATHVGIIDQGALKFQGDISKLNCMKRETISLQTSDNIKAAEILKNEGIKITACNGKIDAKIKTNENIAFINRTLVENFIDIYEIKKSKSELEEIFFSITNNKNI